MSTIARKAIGQIRKMRMERLGHETEKGIPTVESINREMNRRRFAQRAIFSFASLIGLGMPTLAAIYLFGYSPKRESGWVDAGAIGSIPNGVPIEVPVSRIHRDGWKVTAEKDSIWVLKNDKNLIALAPRCTHLGCAYRWESSKSVFVCPCHGSQFSKTGNVISGPASRSLDRLITRIEGDRLWVNDISKSKGQS